MAGDITRSFERFGTNRHSHEDTNRGIHRGMSRLSLNRLSRPLRGLGLILLLYRNFTIPYAELAHVTHRAHGAPLKTKPGCRESHDEMEKFRDISHEKVVIRVELVLITKLTRAANVADGCGGARFRQCPRAVICLETCPKPLVSRKSSSDKQYAVQALTGCQRTD